MVAPPLEPTRDYNALFRRQISRSVTYLQQFVADQAEDVRKLAGEREAIDRAVTLGLELAEVRPTVYDLLRNFSVRYVERQHDWWQRWSDRLERAGRLAYETGERQQAVHLSLLLARLLQRQSLIVPTIHQYRRAIRLARRIGDEISEARACSNLGYLFIERHQWWRAELLCCHALAIFERRRHHHGLAHTENHLGLLDTRRRRWPEAEAHLQRACALWEAMPDRHSLIRGLINLGMLFNDQRRPEPAIRHLDRALHLAKMTGEQAEQGRIYVNLGIAGNLSGHFERAETHLHEAEKIFRQTHNTPELSWVWSNLGLTNVGLGQFDKARDFLTQALITCQQVKNLNGQFNTYTFLIELALARGRPTEAAAHLADATALVEAHPHSLAQACTGQVLADYRRRVDELDR